MLITAYTKLYRLRSKLKVYIHRLRIKGEKRRAASIEPLFRKHSQDALQVTTESSLLQVVPRTSSQSVSITALSGERGSFTNAEDFKLKPLQSFDEFVTIAYENGDRNGTNSADSDEDGLPPGNPELGRAGSSQVPQSLMPFQTFKEDQVELERMRWKEVCMICGCRGVLYWFKA